MPQLNSLVFIRDFFVFTARVSRPIGSTVSFKLARRGSNAYDSFPFSLPSYTQGSPLSTNFLDAGTPSDFFHLLSSLYTRPTLPTGRPRVYIRPRGLRSHTRAANPRMYARYLRVVSASVRGRYGGDCVSMILSMLDTERIFNSLYPPLHLRMLAISSDTYFASYCHLHLRLFRCSAIIL